MAIVDDTKTGVPIEYPKIKTLYKRDPKTFKVIPGEFTLPEFEYLLGCDWQVDEKIDGTNIRVYWDGAEVRFLGRTSRAQIPTQLLEILQDLFPSTRFSHQDPICLYGEGYGAGIQKAGKDYLPDSTHFRLFDVRCGDWWLKTCDVEGVAKSLNILRVPLLYVGTLGTITSVGDGFNSRIGNAQAEGVVVRPTEQLFTRSGARIIAKLKTKDFG